MAAGAVTLDDEVVVVGTTWPASATLGLSPTPVGKHSGTVRIGNTYKNK